MGACMFHEHLVPERLLRAEIAQRFEEGCVVGDLPERLELAIRNGALEAEAERFWAELEALQPERDEPSELGAIRARRAAALRPAARRAKGRGMPQPPEDAALFDRVYGAWLGRCAGCALGKPVEGWSREKIAAYLHAAKAYPLEDYFPVLEPFPAGLNLNACYVATTRGRIQAMVRDDDLDYTVLALRILETYGPEFSTRDVAEAWLRALPYYQIFTAEAVAYRNLLNGIEPPQTARTRNPYREWIGAQIRADMWGYVAPGDPERAATLAYRDAALSHMANGIYGEMWAAAAIAAAMALDDPREIVLAGLAEVPEACRLADAIRDTLRWADEGVTWEIAWERVNARYGNYHWVHVIPNTCAIVLALLYGEGQLERSICLAVMGGRDTDCTGATTGSIVGAMVGACALTAKWVAPLQDRLETTIPGEGAVRLSELAARTVRVAKTVRCTDFA